jgi:LysR family transcriptional regulator for metE and metH
MYHRATGGMAVDLEMRHLRLVEAIAAEGGLTRAGERLHLTQSALSHQLKDIEARLGAPLFLRLKRRMVPTPAGERLLASAVSVLTEVRTAEEAIRRQARLGEGLLRIAVECYTCYHWLPALLAPFQRAFPRVEVRIAAEETGRPAAALLEGRLDMALVSSPLKDPRLRLRPLFEDEMVVVLPPDHPLAGRPFVAPRDFLDENLYLYASPEESTVMRRVLLPAGVTPRRITQVILTEAILELVGAGQGIAVLSSWSVAPAVAAGRLIARPLTARGLVRRWQSARLRAAAEPAWLTGFEDLLARRPPLARLPKRRTKAARS